MGLTPARVTAATIVAVAASAASALAAAQAWCINVDEDASSGEPGSSWGGLSFMRL